MDRRKRGGANTQRKLYEELAEEIALQITAGVLRSGDRLPSIREARKARGLSAATVFHAYDLLENRGLIRTTPRSGHFVSSQVSISAPEPPISSPREGADAVDITNVVSDLMSAVRSRQIIPLGSLFPSPMLFPFDALRRSLSSSARKLDAWSTLDDLPPGNQRLQRQIAKRYLKQGVSVGINEIVLTNGALEALNLCLEAVARPGDAVVVESPCFYYALQALERLRMKAIEVSTHPREGVDLFGLARILETQHPKACWLMTSFQNPLGCSLPREKKQALVDLLSRHQVPLIEDGVYEELYHEGEAPQPAKAFDRAGLVLHCSSFSKTLAPGYRVGWAAAGRFADEVRRLKLMTSMCGSILMQAAVTDYLQQGGYDRHLRRLRQTLMARKEAMVESVTRHFPAGTRLTRPNGGYFIWIDMPWGTADALSLYRSALSKHISIAPGPMFSNHGEFRNCLRLNFGHVWNAETDQAISTLARLATTAPSPTRPRQQATRATTDTTTFLQF
jgi:DNA-binding transcriptional MocR family regulator